MTSTRRQQKQRRAVLERDGYRCVWCGGTATDVDHIMPTALGGPDCPDNMGAACAACNRGKRAALRPPHPVAAPPSRRW